MAKKRHGGLGRGLDALIPQERLQEPIKEETKSITPVEQQSVNGSEETADQIMQTGSSKETADRQLSQMNRDPASESGVRTLRLSQIDPNRSQPRQNFEDEALEELADSIRQFGVLQPILVQKRDEYYEIIAGERRWRAALKAGLKEIPVIVGDYSEKEILELSLIENIQREDLNPIEEAEAYKRLMDEFRLGQAEVAARVSKSRSAVANSLRLLKLEERVRKMVVDGQLSMGHARAILPVEDADQQYELAQKITEKQLSVRETEKIVKEMLKSGAEQDKSIVKIEKQEEDPSIAIIYKQIEERLQQSLHTKVSIQRKRNGHGKLQIDFYNSDDLEKIIDRLTDR